MNELKNSKLKNIFYPILIVLVILIVSAFITSCNSVFRRVDVSYDSLNGLTFSSRDSSHLMMFDDNEVIEKIDDASYEWTFTISGKELSLSDSDEEKKIYVFDKTTLFCEEERDYLYEVTL